MERIQILIVDDEESILELLSYNLVEAGFDVTTATNGIDTLKKQMPLNQI